MSGFSVKYAELCSVSMVQPFYLNGYCKKYTTLPTTDFILQPTTECLATLKRLDCIAKNINEKAGLIILSRVLGTNAGGDDLLRFLPLKGEKLSFWLLLNNSAVYNFDQLPLQSGSGQIFYFSNQLSDAAAPRNNLHLSTNATGVDETVDRITKKSSAYQYHHGATVAPGTAIVKHNLTGTEVKASNIISQGGSAVLYFDLSFLPIGKCKLFISNVDTETFYHMGTDAMIQVFGVVEISLSSALDSNYRVLESDRSLTPARPYYNILFINRSTLWRYTLELTSNSPLFLEYDALSNANKVDFINRLNIITNDTAITFAQTSASPDGKKFHFISNAPVALREKYHSSSSMINEGLALTLKKYVGVAGETAVKTDLPCPSSGSIDASNNPLIYSDILLTI